MKLLATMGLLAMTLTLAGCGTPRASRGEYNVGMCSEGVFLAVHASVGTDITVSVINPGPNRIAKLEKPQVYKYIGKSAEGYKYEFKYSEGSSVLVLQYKKEGIIGLLYIDDEKVAKVYAVKASEADLAKDGLTLFATCQRLQSGSGTALNDN